VLLVYSAEIVVFLSNRNKYHWKLGLQTFKNCFKFSEAVKW